MAQFMPPQNLEDSTLEDDYYAILNLGQNANSEDIINSYRRLSKLYHPDKHFDPEKKKNAEILFNRTKTAYEVLNDPHKRAIYDTLGSKGLQTEGWQIAQRTKTPQEIREEFQQLLQEREQRWLQMRTNPKGTISVGINATELFDPYELDASFPNIEISSMSISQSVEAPLTLNDTAVLNGSLSTQNGNGSGSIGCSVKKVVSSKSWIEYGIGAGNGLVFSLKGFRTLSKHCFGTLQTSCQFTDLGLSPGLELVLAKQLDKQTAGYVTWKAGSSSSVNTTVIRDTEKGRWLGGIQIGIRASFITLNYTHKLEEDNGKVKGAIKFGAFGGIVEYGCEKKISQHSTLGATMAVGIPSGVTLKIKVNRANQTYVFPILLAEEIIPSAVFYGTVAPVIGWCILKTFILDPYQQRQKKRESEKAKEANAERVAERRKEASIAVSLMQETYSRIKIQEEQKSGLVIIRAVYGNTTEISDIDTDPAVSKTEVVDVTIQLQCLVKDSRLLLPDRSKSNLPGFYDPCVGEEKSLLVDYLFNNLAHSITINDNEILRIPSD